jgi:hypothetical protein
MVSDYLFSIQCNIVVFMRSRKGFNDSEDGVEGLPVRLIVVLVIGVIALSAMVAAMNSFKPQKTLTAAVVEVSSKDGNLLQISNSGEGLIKKTWTCYVNVTDDKGDPVSGASVIVYGLGGAGSGVTNTRGRAYISKTNDIRLNPNQNSGYMTLEVHAPGSYQYKNENALAVIRVN